MLPLLFGDKICVYKRLGALGWNAELKENCGKRRNYYCGFGFCASSQDTAFKIGKLFLQIIKFQHNEQKKKNLQVGF